MKFPLGKVTTFYTLQIYSIVWPGIIIQADPLPYSPGMCGFPSGIADGYAGYSKWVLSRYEQQAIRYKDCTDNGDTFICPRPAGRTFFMGSF